MAELDAYRAKRDPARTPEPVPGTDSPAPRHRRRPQPVFVVQEHHARALHWDLRLERDGVLASWAVPKGVPLDPGKNHLAVRTEDHPLEYATFSGRIPDGEYGAGTMTVWDTGPYDTDKWEESEVMVVLHGARVQGRYVLFRTHDDQWMIHRMDPAPEGHEPLPSLVRPMLAVTGELPTVDDDRWDYEFKWDGVRAVAYVEGGRVRFLSRNDHDITGSYAELHAVGEALGARPCILDGEIVALDDAGRPSFSRLQQRMHVTDQRAVRRLARSTPVHYFVFDVLHLDGRATLDLPQRERRAVLESLGLGGQGLEVPPAFQGGGHDVLAAARAQGLEGVVAKHADARYLPGRRQPWWRKTKVSSTQEVVVVGWAPGRGGRAGSLGALLTAVQGEDGLVYTGRVGGGFTEEALREMRARLAPLEQSTSPLARTIPGREAAGATWVRPELVGEVRYSQWTPDGRLRHPVWRGLRTDKRPDEVRREPPATGAGSSSAEHDPPAGSVCDGPLAVSGKGSGRMDGTPGRRPPDPGGKEAEDR